MKEQLINFETAKLAKEKGFDNVMCSIVYCIGYLSIKENREFRGSRRSTVGKQYHLALAPTQSLLQKWLRDKHDIHIWCEKQHKDVKNVYGYRIGSDIEHSSFTFNNWSYEEALELGLQEALKLIDNDK